MNVGATEAGVRTPGQRITTRVQQHRPDMFPRVSEAWALRNKVSRAGEVRPAHTQEAVQKDETGTITSGTREGVLMETVRGHLQNEQAGKRDRGALPVSYARLEGRMVKGIERSREKEAVVGESAMQVLTGKSHQELVDMGPEGRAALVKGLQVTPDVRRQIEFHDQSLNATRLQRHNQLVTLRTAHAQRYAHSSHAPLLDSGLLRDEQDGPLLDAYKRVEDNLLEPEVADIEARGVAKVDDYVGRFKLSEGDATKLRGKLGITNAPEGSETAGKYVIAKDGLYWQMLLSDHALEVITPEAVGAMEAFVADPRTADRTYTLALVMQIANDDRTLIANEINALPQIAALIKQTQEALARAKGNQAMVDTAAAQDRRWGRFGLTGTRQFGRNLGHWFDGKSWGTGMPTETSEQIAKQVIGHQDTLSSIQDLAAMPILAPAQ